MATYAVGDIQGCFATFERLLERIEFTPGRDRLWLVGDLVNRGPRSAAMLRWCTDNDSDLVAVLGNHDLHTLGVAFGVRGWRRRDTARDVLEASDRHRLLDWLIQRPLVHVDGDDVLVHAGLWHGWTVEDARAEAAAVEASLRRSPEKFLTKLFSKKARPFEPGMSGSQRERAVVAVYTRMRVCDVDGRPDYAFAGTPGETIGRGRLPWFKVPGRRSADRRILFGHWSSLGLHVGDGVAGLDTGCVWGGVLSALRLEDSQVFQEPAIDVRDSRRP